MVLRFYDESGRTYVSIYTTKENGRFRATREGLNSN